MTSIINDIVGLTNGCPAGATKGHAASMQIWPGLVTAYHDFDHAGNTFPPFLREKESLSCLSHPARARMSTAPVLAR